jgi:hypothetical protein
MNYVHVSLSASCRRMAAYLAATNYKEVSSAGMVRVFLFCFFSLSSFTYSSIHSLSGPAFANIRGRLWHFCYFVCTVFMLRIKNGLLCCEYYLYCNIRCFICHTLISQGDMEKVRIWIGLLILDRIECKKFL